MTKENLIETAKNMVAAPSCCPELKEIGQAWLDSIGKADEKEKAKILIAEIEEDITPIDSLVEFAHSEEAIKLFGVEGQKNFVVHADELKASGAKYCDCAACKPAQEILANKSLILE